MDELFHVYRRQGAGKFISSLIFMGVFIFIFIGNGHRGLVRECVLECATDADGLQEGGQV